MAGKIFAIGGMYSPEVGQKLFSRFVSLTGKDRPVVAYLGTASGDRYSGMEAFLWLSYRAGAVPIVVPLFQRTPDLSEVFRDVDAVFVGGGNTYSMLAVWRAYGLDRILRDLYDRGIPLGGVSAGAICWFEYALTDSWADRLEVIEGLGFVKGGAVPHYSLEKERRPYTHRYILEGRMPFAYAVEDGVGVLFVDGQPVEVYPAVDGGKAYVVQREGVTVAERPLKT